MKQGYQTWVFANRPSIIAAGTVVGPREAKGPLAKDFDYYYEDLLCGETSFEKAERKLLEEACKIAVEKTNLKKADIQFFLSGDLLNQIISSSFVGKALGAPYLGLFGACSTSMEGLALAALIIDTKNGDNILCSTASHYAAVEKQFRYPTEYGIQKPQTAQWTVTGAGAVILSQQGDGPKVTAATIGRVIDMGLKDPLNLGAAMAPAAVDTISAHFRDLNISHHEYDLIATGDLGKIGRELSLELFKENNVEIPDEKYIDCGLLIYHPHQPMLFSGASGCGCCAVVTYGHILNRIKKGELKKVLIAATGALLSPLSFQQKESIPCIAHAVTIEA